MKKIIFVPFFGLFFFVGFFSGMVSTSRDNDILYIKNEISALQRNANILDDYKIGAITSLENAIEKDMAESLFFIGLSLRENPSLLDDEDKIALRTIFRILPYFAEPDKLKEKSVLIDDAVIKEIERVKINIGIL